MYKWSEEHEMLRVAMKDFVEREIVPLKPELEHGDLAPYGILRKLYTNFGMDDLARTNFRRKLELEKAATGADSTPDVSDPAEPSSAPDLGYTLIPIIEICRHCPGMVTAMGVSVGLTSSAISARGTIAQKERWVEDLLTLDKIGAWAITEPDSGSDAFGSMLSTARRDGDEYLLNGTKTFITNGPWADTIVFICKLDEGNEPAERKILSFVLDSGMDGLEQSGPLQKMGMHSSPTGQLFLSDVRVGLDRLIGETEDPPGGGRSGAKSTFLQERAGVAAMSLGIIEQCLELSVSYARERIQFGQRIGDFQLIQQKLALMELARMNVQNLVFRTMELTAAGETMTLAEASAMKLYAARAATDVALDAVQVHGGNGYMAEFQVEQLARDAKVLQIYAGTDEIQTIAIAKDLLNRP